SLPAPLHPISPLFPYTTLFRSSVPFRNRCRPASRRKFMLPSYEPEPFGIWHAVDSPHAMTRGEGRRYRLNTQLSRRCNEGPDQRSEEHTSELQSRFDLVCRLLL